MIAAIFKGVKSSACIEKYLYFYVVYHEFKQNVKYLANIQISMQLALE